MEQQVDQTLLLPAQRLLWYIQEQIDTRAVIAGGFCRDLLTGRTPKDVDLWLYNDISSTQLRAISPEIKVTQSIFLRESPAIKRIIRVVFKGLNFDVIQLRDPSVLPHERFDFGINQAWHNGHNFDWTNEFQWDVENHTLTYLETEENFDRFERIRKDRVPRMLAKFPGYELRGVTFGTDGVMYPNSSPNFESFQARKLAKLQLTPVTPEVPSNVPKPPRVESPHRGYG